MLKILILITATSEKEDPGWLDPSVIVAIVGGVAAVAVAYLTYLGIKANIKKDERPMGDPTTASDSLPPDLLAAAAARVEALNTFGPARTKRLAESRVALERAAAALDKAEHAHVRALALQLLDSTDPAAAADLRDQLTRASI